MGENTLTHMIGEIIGRRAEKNMYLGEVNKLRSMSKIIVEIPVQVCYTDITDGIWTASSTNAKAKTRKLYGGGHRRNDP